VRALAAVDTDRVYLHRIKDAEDLFASLRQRIESAGVFVLLIGDLGNYHSAISPSVFRGFAIADQLAPLVVINDQDARTAWSFTLVHELVHILAGTTGVTAAATTTEPRTRAAKVERFCNDVAGEVLLPRAALNSMERLPNKEMILAAAERLSDEWKVSCSMAAYRLWQTGKADAETYREAFAVLAARWRVQREREKEQDGDGGPSYYTVRRHRLGDALLKFVGRSLRADLITHTTAGKLLGVRPGAVEALLSGVNGLGNPPPARRRA
jgi:Zn-dependent peptidase ImmA (M78 family)